MPLLQVKDCPDDLYKAISRGARQWKRSIDEEILVILMDAVHRQVSGRDRRRQVLAEIAMRKVPEAAQNVDVVSLIYEDHTR